MAAVVERGQVRVLRPILGFPKSMLLATLRARGVPWIEDPSNSDPRFARARLRGRPSGMAGLFGDASARLRLNDAAARFLAAHATIGEARSVRFERASFRALRADEAQYLLGRILGALADDHYVPPTAALSRLTAALVSTGDGATTLGGCLVRFGQRWIRIRPEGVAMLPWCPPVPIAPVPFGAGPVHASILLHSPGNLCST
jgi:tRNA(Ile)-lysidine synthase